MRKTTLVGRTASPVDHFVMDLIAAAMVSMSSAALRRTAWTTLPAERVQGKIALQSGRYDKCTVRGRLIHVDKFEGVLIMLCQYFKGLDCNTGSNQNYRLDLWWLEKCVL